MMTLLVEFWGSEPELLCFSRKGLMKHEEACKEITILSHFWSMWKSFGIPASEWVQHLCT